MSTHPSKRARAAMVCCQASEDNRVGLVRKGWRWSYVVDVEYRTSG